MNFKEENGVKCAVASGLKGFRDPTSDEGGISDIHEIFQL